MLALALFLLLAAAGAHSILLPPCTGALLVRAAVPAGCSCAAAVAPASAPSSASGAPTTLRPSTGIDVASLGVGKWTLTVVCAPRVCAPPAAIPFETVPCAGDEPAGLFEVGTNIIVTLAGGGARRAAAAAAAAATAALAALALR
jgi:hypothetical protein